MSDPVLIFDLDGTLVDSAPDLTHSLNYTLTGDGLETAELSEVRKMVGQGARRLIETAVEWQGADRSTAEVDALLDIFLDHYSRNLCVDTAAFPGVAETVEQLARRHKLGICTNKPVDLAVRLVADLGYAGYFPVILGGDSLPWKKPDARHIDATRDRLAPGARAIMVGDSMTDIGAARNAGIPVIAVSYGYTAIPVADFKADVVVDHFADLPAAIDEIISSGLLDRQ